MRAKRGLTQKAMAADLGVSAAYLSALEHGNRGAPPWTVVQKIIGYFNVIWDEAEELESLAAQSHPRVVIDTAGLEPSATLLANLLSEKIGQLDGPEIERLIAQLRAKGSRKEPSDPQSGD